MNAVFDHLALNWGNWASVVGLGASLGSFFKARAAANAATDARDAVRARALTDDVGDCASAAQHLLDMVRHDRLDADTVRSGDLHARISYCSRRWHDKLPMDDASKIVTARDKAGSVSRALEGSVATASKKRLIRTCHEIIEILSELHGNAANRAE